MRPRRHDKSIKIFIANNSLAAIKFIISLRRTSREIEFYGVSTAEDLDSEYIRFLKDFVILPSGNSQINYSNISLMVSVAQKFGVDFVFPGWGFLSENYKFVEALETAGIGFLGPESRSIFLLADKLASTKLCQELGIPTIPSLEFEINPNNSVASKSDQITPNQRLKIEEYQTNFKEKKSCFSIIENAQTRNRDPSGEYKNPSNTKHDTSLVFDSKFSSFYAEKKSAHGGLKTTHRSRSLDDLQNREDFSVFEDSYDKRARLNSCGNIQIKENIVKIFKKAQTTEILSGLIKSGKLSLPYNSKSKNKSYTSEMSQDSLGESSFPNKTVNMKVKGTQGIIVYNQSSSIGPKTSKYARMGHARKNMSNTRLNDVKSSIDDTSEESINDLSRLDGSKNIVCGEDWIHSANNKKLDVCRKNIINISGSTMANDRVEYIESDKKDFLLATDDISNSGGTNYSNSDILAITSVVGDQKPQKTSQIQDFYNNIWTDFKASSKLKKHEFESLKKEYGELFEKAVHRYGKQVVLFYLKRLKNLDYDKICKKLDPFKRKLLEDTTNFKKSASQPKNSIQKNYDCHKNDTPVDNLPPYQYANRKIETEKIHRSVIPESDINNLNISKKTVPFNTRNRMKEFDAINQKKNAVLFAEKNAKKQDNNIKGTKRFYKSKALTINFYKKNSKNCKDQYLVLPPTDFESQKTITNQNNKMVKDALYQHLYRISNSDENTENNFRTNHLQSENCESKNLYLSNLTEIKKENEIKRDISQSLKDFSMINEYPLILKCTVSGGGKGIRVLYSESDAINAFEQAKNEGGGQVMICKLILNCRHIELQCFRDKYGNTHVIGGRDCTLQRRHQKLIEESLSESAFYEKYIFQMESDAKKLLQEARYTGVATVEFLCTIDRYYFLEVNTRIQVEHPITEIKYNVNIPQTMLEIALGTSFEKFETINRKKHVIGVRIIAEDPEYDFTPNIGNLDISFIPRKGVLAYFSKFHGKISNYSDSQFGHVFVYASTRKRCIKKLSEVLEEIRIKGLKTTVQFSKFLVKSHFFNRNTYDIHTLEKIWQNRNNPMFHLPPIIPIFSNQMIDHREIANKFQHKINICNKGSEKGESFVLATNEPKKDDPLRNDLRTQIHIANSSSLKDYEISKEKVEYLNQKCSFNNNIPIEPASMSIDSVDTVTENSHKTRQSFFHQLKSFLSIDRSSILLNPKVLKNGESETKNNKLFESQIVYTESQRKKIIAEYQKIIKNTSPNNILDFAFYKYYCDVNQKSGILYPSSAFENALLMAVCIFWKLDKKKSEICFLMGEILNKFHLYRLDEHKVILMRSNTYEIAEITALNELLFIKIGNKWDIIKSIRTSSEERFFEIESEKIGFLKGDTEISNSAIYSRTDGKVISILQNNERFVEKDDILVEIEIMKIRKYIRAPLSGKVRYSIKENTEIKVGMELAKIESKDPMHLPECKRQLSGYFPAFKNQSKTMLEQFYNHLHDHDFFNDKFEECHGTIDETRNVCECLPTLHGCFFRVFEHLLEQNDIHDRPKMLSRIDITKDSQQPTIISESSGILHDHRGDFIAKLVNNATCLSLLLGYEAPLVIKASLLMLNIDLNHICKLIKVLSESNIVILAETQLIIHSFIDRFILKLNLDNSLKIDTSLIDLLSAVDKIILQKRINSHLYEVFVKLRTALQEYKFKLNNLYYEKVDYNKIAGFLKRACRYREGLLFLLRDSPKFAPILLEKYFKNLFQQTKSICSFRILKPSSNRYFMENSVSSFAQKSLRSFKDNIDGCKNNVFVLEITFTSDQKSMILIYFCSFGKCRGSNGGIHINCDQNYTKNQFLKIIIRKHSPFVIFSLNHKNFLLDTILLNFVLQKKVTT